MTEAQCFKEELANNFSSICSVVVCLKDILVHEHRTGTLWDNIWDKSFAVHALTVTVQCTVLHLGHRYIAHLLSSTSAACVRDLCYLSCMPSRKAMMPAVTRSSIGATIHRHPHTHLHLHNHHHHPYPDQCLRHVEHPVVRGPEDVPQQACHPQPAAAAQAR